MPLSSKFMREVVHGIAFAKKPPAWWESRNVVGLCFAPKRRCGRIEDVTLQVHVRHKRESAKIPARLRVPRSIVHHGKRIDTDVREVGDAHLEVLVSTQRPTWPGYNVGHDDEGSGTMGCVVRSRATGELLGLSCAHVVARGGRAVAGERVLVPSRVEAANLGQLGRARFGTLVRSEAPSANFADATRNVDAATIRPNDAAHLHPEIALVGSAPAGTVANVQPGMTVKKVGAATELTFGVVDSVHWTVSLPYVQPDGSVRQMWFTDQVGITRFTAPGDSGSLVLEDGSNLAIGMHIGSTATLSVCTPIAKVLHAVDCDLVTAP